jgi:hypothetical protein
MLTFNSYLVLENSAGETKVLVPIGIITSPLDAVIVKTAEDVGAELQLYAYDVHPRLKTLRSPSIAARLYLACLYAATASMLPEPRQGMTGDEYAINLLRECWVNRPLTTEEADNLGQLLRYCSRAPALKLLCRDLYNSSQMLSFAHSDEKSEKEIDDDFDFDKVATEYRIQSKLGHNKLNPRTRLTTTEYSRIFADHPKSSKLWRHNKKYETIVVGSYEAGSGGLPRYGGMVEDIEVQLRTLVKEKPRAHRVFPLKQNKGAGILEGREFQELKDSWEAYHSQADVVLDSNPPEMSCFFEDLKAKVLRSRKELELHFTSVFNIIPREDEVIVVIQAPFLRLSKEIPPLVNRSDLLRMAVDKAYFKELYPFLTATSRANIYEDILLWMKLCVLEDKLDRLLILCHADSEQQLVKELEVYRVWKAEDHPRWLVFEVEGRLQIRPKQYIVANAILTNPGAIVQLNMGEGKTRVIIPMIIMQLTSSATAAPKDNWSIPRIHFLTALLSEGFAHIHEFLTASVLNVKLFCLPFSREVELDIDKVNAIHNTLIACRQERGAVVIAPEHRLSLYLKRFDLTATDSEGTAEAVRRRLIDLDTGYRFVDILDESDEILRHKYNLIYSVGNHMGLEAGSHRWTVCQALLMAIKRDVHVRKLLQSPALAKIETVDGLDDFNNFPAFPRLRLLPGSELDSQKGELLRALANAVINDPPYELRWLRACMSLKEDIVRFVTEERETVRENLVSQYQADTPQFADLLALRGYLACGLLTNSLQQRHRVNYGVKRVGGATKKRLAVPFRACDTPSERSEYAHPDSAICFTTLSYYYDGLTRMELVTAFGVLLRLGLTAQETIYNEWFSLAYDGMSTETCEKIDTVRKIDLSNAVQVDVLHSQYGKNICTVNFWLINCVFPIETVQYPYKIVATPWDLANNPQGQCMGFSGTDDNRDLQPLQVHQQRVEDSPELSATNGMMLARTLGNPEYIDLSEGTLEAPWKAALDVVLAKGCSAIIDAGALFVGLNNSDIATKILGELIAHPDIPLRSVLFFNTDKSDPSKHGWRIRDVKGREWPRHSAPIRDADCFVFFDESRCRGADVKMRSTAKAALTVGPRMCKDKLMQAAGRMRMLDKGQSLVFIGDSEVTRKIKVLNEIPQLDDPTSLHLLEWVMHNTIEETKAGLLEWSHQGALFCATNEDPEYAILDESNSLSHLYDHQKVAQPVTEIHRADVQRYAVHRKNAPLSESMHKLSTKIAAQVENFGSDVSFLRSSVDEECERELEKEVEQEEEEERHLPRMIAVRERDWTNYESVLRCRDVADLRALTGVKSLRDVVNTSRYIDWKHKINYISFAACNGVYSTANFIDTVAYNDDNPSPNEEYLRPVDAVLWLPRVSSVVLLSEREADKVLPILAAAKKSIPSADVAKSDMPRFLNLNYLRPSTSVSLKWSTVSNFPTKSLVQLQLFNGETSYPTSAQKAELTALLAAGGRDNVKTAQSAALVLPVLRGLHFMISRSDLEMICTRENT